MCEKENRTWNGIDSAIIGRLSFQERGNVSQQWRE